MSHLSVLLVILGLLIPRADPPSGERVLWAPGKALNWEHFQGVPDAGSRFAAMSKIDLSIAQGPLDRPDAIELIVSTELMTGGSWVKRDKMTDRVLRHEQGHFDIAEYHARRLRKALMDLSPLKASKLEVEVDRVFERIFNEKQAMQQAYDRDTDHSMREKPQAEWEERIAVLLESTMHLEDRSVVLEIR